MMTLYHFSVYFAMTLVLCYCFSTRIAGLLDTSEHAVTVSFNVIVPLSYWLWNEKSKLSLRFGKQLGNWSMDVGDFVLHK